MAEAIKHEETEDKLEGYWLIIVWCSMLIPCLGAWIIVILSSVMYYVWKKDYPNKAKKINLHGWLAWLSGHVVWVCGWILLNVILALVFGVR